MILISYICILYQRKYQLWNLTKLFYFLLDAKVKKKMKKFSEKFVNYMDSITTRKNLYLLFIF